MIPDVSIPTPRSGARSVRVAGVTYFFSNDRLVGMAEGKRKHRLSAKPGDETMRRHMHELGIMDFDVVSAFSEPGKPDRT